MIWEIRNFRGAGAMVAMVGVVATAVGLATGCKSSSTTPAPQMALRSQMASAAEEQTFEGMKREEGLHPTDPKKDTTMLTTDSMGAIGPNYIVQMVNFRVAVFDRKTKERVREATLKEFFTVGNFPEGPVVGDPRVIYDPLSQRWFACGMDRPAAFKNNRILLAVSDGPDPVPPNATADLADRSWIPSKWKAYYLKGNEAELLADYPTLGVDANGVYVSMLYFDYQARTPVSVRKVVAIPKSDLVAWTDTREQPIADANVFTIANSAGGHVIQPAQSFDSSARGGNAWFVSKGEPTSGPNRYRPGRILYGKLKWNSATRIFEKQPGWFDRNLGMPAPASVSYWDIPISGPPFNAPQKSSYGLNAPVPLANANTHVLSAVLRNNSIWVCQHVGFNSSGGYRGSGAIPPDRSGVVWFKYHLGGGANPKLTHTFPFATYGRIWDSGDSPRWFYYPSLMVNASGDVLIGFSGANSNEFISAFYQVWTGNKTKGPVLLQAGRDFFNFGSTSRWADYSATALDPLDSETFCTFQPYGDSEPSGPGELEPRVPRWGTTIAIINPDGE